MIRIFKNLNHQFIRKKIHPYFYELTEMLLETVLLKCKLNGMIYEKCIMDQIAVVWFSRLTIWEKWQAN